MSNITVHIYTPQELNHSSYIQTGLFELEKEGFLKTRVVLSSKKRVGTIKINEQQLNYVPRQAHPKTSYYKIIDHAAKKSITFATDLYDAADSFSLYALKNCDFVFKRNYVSNQVDLLPKEYRDKIYPLGWTFGVHSDFRKGRINFFLGLLFSNLRMLKKDRRLFKRISQTITNQWKHWNFVQTTRPLESFEAYSPTNAKDTIVFQTRCFVHENDLKLKELHHQRYQIIKLLQHHFPDQFKGGFIPTAIAKQEYKDALTNLPTDPASYLALVKASKIGIYTQGIQDSPAWKMAEYLSQGKVIIAQRFQTELPVPIENLKEVLIFDKLEEIPDLCKKVFSNKQLASDLSANGRKYYQLHISPGRNVKRILNLMLTE